MEREYIDTIVEQLNLGFEERKHSIRAYREFIDTPDGICGEWVIKFNINI
jgi:hypothetical protein